MTHKGIGWGLHPFFCQDGEMTFDDFVNEVIQYFTRPHEQRFGQASMNVLLYIDPALSKKVSTDIWEINDPQHPKVLDWFADVERQWDDD